MSAEASSSSSKVDSSEKMDVLKKATELLAQGKRNMVCNEVPKAVTLFEEAVKILVDSCGELSRDCADAYFNCGSALLELGRMESTVLGAALEGVDVEEEKDAEEEAGSDQFEKPPADDGDKTAEGDGDNEDEDMADENTNDDETAEEEGAASQDEEHKGDDVGNFQLAWEYLDLARIIYLKSDTKDDQIKAAECHLKLGEISMETEQHATAAEDLESALKIQKKFLEKDDRLIAETHYTLGLAYGLDKDFVSSIEHYQTAVSVIEARIASLTKFVEEREVDAENKENNEEDALKKHKEEIKNLRSLVPEMNEKIEDTKIEQKEQKALKEMAKEALGLGSITSMGFGSSSSKVEDSGASGSAANTETEEKKATDITSLVRKKRKPEEEVNDTEVKKICKDNSGDASTEVHEKLNGHAEVKEVSS